MSTDGSLLELVTTVAQLRSDYHGLGERLERLEAVIQEHSRRLAGAREVLDAVGADR